MNSRQTTQQARGWFSPIRNPNSLIPHQFRNWMGDEDFLNDLSQWGGWGNFRNWAAVPWQRQKNTTRTGNTYFQEYPDKWELEIELPGRRPDEVQIWVDGRKLEISTVARHERTENVENNENTRGYRNERTFAAWKESFDLPEDVSYDTIKAKLSDGLLRVVMPRETSCCNARHQIQLTDLI